MCVYVSVKRKGRIGIYKDGEFDHQQFRGHWGYARPDEYLEHCKRLDREAEQIRAEERAARLDAVRAYLAKRAARACHRQLGLFA